MNLYIYKRYLIISCLININYLFRAEAWVRALNNSKLVVEEAHMYNRDVVVCQRHFETSQYNTPKRLRLNRNAVPTLFLTSSDASEDVHIESQIQKVVSSERLVICIMIYHIL
jgi:hypothetical protein